MRKPIINNLTEMDLDTLCYFPRETVYLHELAKKIGKTPSTIHSYLNRLETAKLIKTVGKKNNKKGEKKYYKITELGEVHRSQYIDYYNCKIYKLKINRKLKFLKNQIGFVKK